MNNTALVIGLCLAGDQLLAIEAFARACGTDAEFIRQLVDEELLQPATPAPDWRFGGEQLARARRILRLQRDFEASLPSVAVMLELLDEIERLRSALRREGIALPEPDQSG